MKKFYLLSYLIFSMFSLVGQNLVPNPSFEVVSCQTDFFFPWGCPITNNEPWQMPNEGSSDSYNACHTGDFGNFAVPINFQGNEIPFNELDSGFAGVITIEGVGDPNYREYLQVQLTEPLVADETYSIGFYCSLAEQAQLASDGLGMHISVDPISVSGQGVIEVIPHLVTEVITNTFGWTEVSGTYVASGGEEYIIIGNFYNDDNTATQPTGIGTFDRAYYYIDEVSVQSSMHTSTSALNREVEILDISPNPAINTATIEGSKDDLSELKITDLMGREMSRLVKIDFLSETKATLDLTNIPSGIYLVSTKSGYGKLVKN